MGVAGHEIVGEDLEPGELGLLPHEDSKGLLGLVVEKVFPSDDAGDAVINGGDVGDLDTSLAHTCFLLG
jgi:hypothetical protein